MMLQPEFEGRFLEAFSLTRGAPGFARSKPSAGEMWPSQELRDLLDSESSNSNANLIQRQEGHTGEQSVRRSHVAGHVSRFHLKRDP